MIKVNKNKKKPLNTEHLSSNDTITNDQFSFWLKSAEEGDAEFQFIIGSMCHQGMGREGKPLYPKAYEWYEKAAKQGHPNAQNNLGHMYLHAEGLDEPDYNKARIIFEQIIQKNQNTKIALGHIYENGLGLTHPNYKEAHRLFSEITESEDKNGEGSFRLGNMYLLGFGRDTDYDKARELFTISSKKNNANAMNNLAYMCQYGLGLIAPNNKQASKLYAQAAKRGDKNVSKNLENIEFKNKAYAEDYTKKVPKKSGFTFAKQNSSTAEIHAATNAPIINFADIKARKSKQL